MVTKSAARSLRTRLLSSRLIHRSNIKYDRPATRFCRRMVIAYNDTRLGRRSYSWDMRPTLIKQVLTVRQQIPGRASGQGRRVPHSPRRRRIGAICHGLVPASLTMSRIRAQHSVRRYPFARPGGSSTYSGVNSPRCGNSPEGPLHPHAPLTTYLTLSKFD
jgi:hypothetical protein